MARDILNNFTLFMDGGPEVGNVMSFTPPNLGITEEDFKAAGLDIPISVDQGMEKMQARFVMHNQSQSSLARFGLATGINTILKVKGVVKDTNTGVPAAVYHTCTGKVVSIEQSEWQPGQKAGVTVTMTLSYYQQTYNGVPVITVDRDNYIREIAGVDQLAGQRVILGR